MWWALCSFRDRVGFGLISFRVKMLGLSPLIATGLGLRGCRHALIKSLSSTEVWGAPFEGHQFYLFSETVEVRITKCNTEVRIKESWKQWTNQPRRHVVYSTVPICASTADTAIASNKNSSWTHLLTAPNSDSAGNFEIAWLWFICLHQFSWLRSIVRLGSTLTRIFLNIV